MNLFKQLKDMTIGFDFESIYGQKVSKSILKVFGLFAVLFIIICVKLYLDFNAGFNEFERVMKNSPYFTIINGELSLEAPQPFYPLPGEDNIIIDTTGNTSPSVLDNMPDGVLVTKTKVYSKTDYETRSFDLKVVNDISNSSNVTRNDITSWIMNFKAPFYIIAVLFLTVYETAAKFMSALILSLVLLIAAAVMKKTIKYGALFGLSLYALVLPVLLDWIRSLAGVPVPFFSLAYWLVALLYGIMGVKKYSDVTDVTDVPGPEIL